MSKQGGYAMTQERQIKDCIAKVDRMSKQLKTFRETLTDMLYNTPTDAPDPIKLPKEKTVHKPYVITESLSIRPGKGRRELSLDDFMDALKDSGMETYEQGWQTAYGADSGCKIQVDGEIIAAFEYPAPVGECEGSDSIVHKNLVINQCYPHPHWKAISRVLRSL